MRSPNGLIFMGTSSLLASMLCVYADQFPRP
jgi:hypothetical protein